MLEHINLVIDQIDYDFGNFTIEDFADWVAERRGKPIVLQPWEAMPKGVFGLWLSCPETEYIYYYNQMPPTLKLMTLLHELSHIYLNHKTLIVTSAFELLLALTLNNKNQKTKAMARDVFDRDSQEEQEAETLALLLLERVLKHSPSNYGLNTPGTDYLKAMKVL